MMFAKTVCNRAGSYVQAVPVGLIARLQYNHNGLLETMYVGHNSVVEFTEEQFKAAQNLVPITIHTTGGTTWVEGVFYFDKVSTAPGALPECTYEDYLSRIVNGESACFYGFFVNSLAVSLKGVLATRNWLTISKFNILPGTVVPYNMTESTLEMIWSQAECTFEYPYIAGYVFWSNTDCEFVVSELRQCTVKSVSTSVTGDGYYVSTLKTDDTNLVFNLSDVATYNIQTATLVLYGLTEYGVPVVVSTKKIDNKTRDRQPSKIKCLCCGKEFLIPQTGLVQCDDEQCLSRMYPNVRKLLKVLNLDEMSSDRYKEVIKNKDVTCLTDILCLPEYKDIHIQTTVLDALNSVVPASVCSDISFLKKFVNSCSNSVETIMYYAQNPRRIITDLNIEGIQATRFVEWLSEPGVVMTLKSIFMAVETACKTTKFDGPPMFRGRKFILTGKFLRGPHSDIKAILESYSGQVVSSFDDCPDVVLVGGLNEDIDGQLIQKARSAEILIRDENSFFEWYKIDADLASNLL